MVVLILTVLCGKNASRGVWDRLGASVSLCPNQEEELIATRILFRDLTRETVSMAEAFETRRVRDIVDKNVIVHG